MTFSKFNEELKYYYYLFQSLDLSNIYELNTSVIAQLMFSCFNGSLRAVFEDYFTKNSERMNIYIIRYPMSF